MDLDRFLATNSPSWRRLSQLSERARGRDMQARELEELVGLYRRAAGDLSLARTTYPGAAVIPELSAIVAGASSVIYGSRGRGRLRPGRFLSTTFPAAVWHIRRLFLVSAALTFLPALAVGIWLAHSDSARQASATPAERSAYVNHDFAHYYRSEPAATFASQVYFNNIEVAAEAYAGGVLAGVPTVFALVNNGANVGFAAGLFTHAGEPGRFWGLILPHGMLELTSVILAGAGGLRLGVTLIDPGDRTRLAALAEEGKRAVVLIIGTMITLAVAGMIEGFVTGSSLPTVVRVGFGVVVEVVFLTWMGICGPRAAAAGYTGRFGERPDDPAAEGGIPELSAPLTATL